MKKLYSVLTAAALMPLCLLAGQVSQASQADEYNPEVRNLQVREGEYRIARELVKNAKKLPENTVYEFVPEPNFAKAGTYKTRIRLLYPDNSMETSQEVTVSVYDHAWQAKKTVKKHKKAKKSKKAKKRVSDAKRYQAKVKGKSTAFGQAFKSKRLVTNRAKLPKKTSFRFARVPNFKRAGSYYTAVLVTYPDKSQEYTRQVKVTVKRQKDKSKYQPKVKGKTVAYGAKLTAKSLIKNAKSLPKKSKYKLSQKINTKQAGTYLVAVKVTYPDKSWEVTRFVKVTVKRQTDKARYQVKVRPGQVTLGQKLAPSQLVTNLSSLPKKSKFAFTAQPNWQKAGSYRTKIQVTYPDKSKETSAFLTVTVKNPADSSRYTPVLLAAKTQVGKAIPASSLIANFASLPAGSQASYLTAPDFAKAGSYKTQIKVTYPDKSTWTSSEFMIEVAPGAESMQSN